jgi:hypothetical protein
MKYVNFTDTTTAAMVNIIAADKIMSIQTTDADTIVVKADIIGSLDTAGASAGFDGITITATGNAIVVAKRLAEYISGTAIGGDNMLDVTSGNTKFPEVSAIVYAAVV